MVRGARFLALVALALAVPACGGGRKGLVPAPVPGTVLVTPTSGLITVETPGGATAQFTVVLGKAPTADVTIAVSSSNALEGTPSTNSLLFTSTNWDTAQTVTVTGVDGFVADGDQAYTIVLAPTASADSTYVGIDPTDVSVTNQDDDVAGFSFSATSGLVTTENGGTATFTVVLTSQPVAGVSFDLSSDNTLAGTVSPTTLTFTDGSTLGDPDAWNVPHTVTVTGVNDTPPAINVPVVYHIVATISTSADPNYSGKTVLAAPGVTVTNNDNDAASITATPTSGLVTSESGGTATFTVVLNTVPAADVVIAVTSQNTSAGLVSSAGSLTPGTTLNLTFTNLNWNTAQTVTLTGVDDPAPKVNAAVAYTVKLHPTSADAAYDTANLADVTISASNASDDTAGLTISKLLTGLTTNEAALQDTFTVQLDTVPSADVVVNLTSTKTAEGTVSPATLTFTTANWNTAQTVTVTGVNDFVIDGNVAYAITVAVDPGTADVDYAAVVAASVPATNNDNDAPGFSVSKASVLTSEAGTTDTFTVALTSAPVSAVTVTLSVTLNPAEASVTPTLTFAANNSALTPQTVTVTGLNDLVVDGNVNYTITISATAGDPAYTGLTPVTVAGINNDNDIVIPPGAGGWAAHRVITPALPAATPGAWDEKSQQEPSVLKLGPTDYRMWYEGANAGGQKHEQIGLATSTNGTAWTKVANPVLPHSGINGEFDKNGAGDPSVVFDGTTYRMWYAGRENAATKNKIGLATSPDGINWTKNPTNPVLLGTGGTFDSVGVSGPQVLLVGATYHMWYTGLDASGVARIGHAWSSNGITWTKTAGAVLSQGTAGSFDAQGAKLCAVLLDGAKYRMWYVGLDVTGPAGRQRLGYADSNFTGANTDGAVWTKFQANPVLSAGAAGAFDEKNLWSPSVILDGATFKMWYGGENNAGTIRIGYVFTP